MGQFVGFVELDGTIPVTTLVLSSGSPAAADALPKYRVYGPQGLMSNGSGTAAFTDTGSVTGASNAGPIVITSTGHGLTTGTRVTVTGVTGNTAANGTFVVTYASADTFSLNGSTGNGAYAGGGVWSVTGLYTSSIVAAAADGYESGETYGVLFFGAVSTTSWADLLTFVVT